MTAAMTVEGLRARMVAGLPATTVRVRAALGEVPRHLFLPDAPLEMAYADVAVVIKWENGAGPLASASAPSIVAMMLGQAGVQPGQRVLEIGVGSGWNAALLSYLVGDAGRVTTVELDPEVAEDARRALVAAGCSNVDVVCGDGTAGFAGDAPYDRVIVTANVWELPAVWFEQLTVDGRLVAPLRLRGSLQRSVALERCAGGDWWRSRTIHECGFIPLRERDTSRPRRLTLPTGRGGGADSDVAIEVHGEQADDIDPGLRDVLDLPDDAQEAWSGVVFGREESFEWLGLSLACHEPGFTRLLAGPHAVERGVVRPAFAWGSLAVWHGASLAYLTVRAAGDRAVEVGVCGHGPFGGWLAERVCGRVRVWDRTHRAAPVPLIDAHPHGDVDPEGLDVGQFCFSDRPGVPLVVTWPHRTRPGGDP